MKSILLIGACALSLTSSTHLRQNYMYPQNSFGYQPYLNPFSYFPFFSYFSGNGMMNAPIQVPSIPTPQQLPNQVPEIKPATPSLPAQTPTPAPVLPGNVMAPSYPVIPAPTAQGNDIFSMMGLYGLPQQANSARMTGDNIFGSLLGSLNPILQSLSANSTHPSNSTDPSKGNDVLINNVKLGVIPPSTGNSTNSQANTTLAPTPASTPSVDESNSTHTLNSTVTPDQSKKKN